MTPQSSTDQFEVTQLALKPAKHLVRVVAVAGEYEGRRPTMSDNINRLYHGWFILGIGINGTAVHWRHEIIGGAAQCKIEQVHPLARTEKKNSLTAGFEPTRAMPK